MSGATLVALGAIVATLVLAIVTAAWHLGARLTALRVTLDTIHRDLAELRASLKPEIARAMRRHERHYHGMVADPSLSGVATMRGPRE